MYFPKSIVCFAIPFFALVKAVSGAPRAPDQATVCFGSWEQPSVGLFYKTGKHYISLDAPAYKRGKPLPLPPDRRIVLYRALSNETPTSYESIGQWQAPKDALRTWALLIVSPQGKVEPILLNDDIQNFKPGSIRIVNITPSTIATKVGDVVQEIPSLRAAVLQPTADSADKRDRLDYAIALPNAQGAMTVVFKKLLWINPAHRTTYIVAYTKNEDPSQDGFHPGLFKVNDVIASEDPNNANGQNLSSL